MNLKTFFQTRVAQMNADFSRMSRCCTEHLPGACASAKEVLNKSRPFGLSLPKPVMLQVMPFDKLRVNGFVQSLPKKRCVISRLFVSSVFQMGFSG